MKVRPERAAVIALGCPKNRVDSEYLLGALAEAGYELTAEPETADTVILTTCAFIKPAVEESFALIQRLSRLKHRHPGMKLLVAGCLVQRFGSTLNRKFPAVDHWIKMDQLTSIPELLGRKTGPGCRLISTPFHYAYLKIADGCNNHCSYCLIPKIRGPFRSRPLSELEDEAQHLAAVGVRELILIAQDTTAYGTDLYGKPSLARLFNRLSRIKEITWLRLMYAHPAHLSEDVIEQFGTNPKLCRYIDLPIQHISDRLLKLMNRHYSRNDVARLLERLKQIPDMCIRTTVITGFPGETRKEFRELVDFIRSAEFDRLAGYVFSPEPGTPAAAMKPPVRPATARHRLKTIMRIQTAISRRKLRRLANRELIIIAR
ncbi:MAG: 30S ribosomal protein S12 methylthiotransferase RimO, partial [candidate division WOR-3 bacterium]